MRKKFLYYLEGMMTLIVGVLTNVKNYIFADKMHSIDGTKENPATATVKTEKTTINISSPNIRIDGGTKIYKISDDVFVAGAGDLGKIKRYVQSIEHETINTLVEKTQDYYTNNRSNSPDDLLILFKTTEISIHIFTLNTSYAQKDEMFSFGFWKFSINENSIGVLALGSGSQLFLPMYHTIKEECTEKYREALIKNEYPKWELWFMEKIKQMYNDISKYDDAVGNDIEIVELA